MKVFTLIMNWVISRLFGGGDTQSRDDNVNLGKAQNELDHVRQDEIDRQKLADLRPAGPDDAVKRLRDGSY